MWEHSGRMMVGQSRYANAAGQLLLKAVAISVAVHLAAFGAWTWGQTHILWKGLSMPAWLQLTPPKSPFHSPARLARWSRRPRHAASPLCGCGPRFGRRQAAGKSQVLQHGRHRRRQPGKERAFRSAANNRHAGQGGENSRARRAVRAVAALAAAGAKGGNGGEGKRRKQSHCPSRVTRRAAWLTPSRRTR